MSQSHRPCHASPCPDTPPSSSRLWQGRCCPQEHRQGSQQAAGQADCRRRRHRSGRRPHRDHHVGSRGQGWRQARSPRALQGLCERAGAASGQGPGGARRGAAVTHATGGGCGASAGVGGAPHLHSVLHGWCICSLVAVGLPPPPGCQQTGGEGLASIGAQPETPNPACASACWPTDQALSSRPFTPTHRAPAACVACAPCRTPP